MVGPSLRAESRLHAPDEFVVAQVALAFGPECARPGTRLLQRKNANSTAILLDHNECSRRQLSFVSPQCCHNWR
jgi:hypothetical protein